MPRLTQAPRLVPGLSLTTQLKRYSDFDNRNHVVLLRSCMDRVCLSLSLPLNSPKFSLFFYLFWFWIMYMNNVFMSCDVFFFTCFITKSFVELIVQFFFFSLNIYNMFVFFFINYFSNYKMYEIISLKSTIQLMNW